MKINKVERVVLSGGLIGLFATNPQKALQKKFEAVNAQGWNVKQIIPDTSGNLINLILRLLILLITFLLWTPANGFFVILEKETDDNTKEPVSPKQIQPKQITAKTTAPQSQQWFISYKGKEHGPFDTAKAKMLVKKYGNDVQIWKEDFTEWKPCEDVPELS